MTEKITGRILPLYVLAREIAPPTTTKAGLIINHPSVKQPIIKAEVILTGEGTKYDDMHIKIGDRILFSPNSFRKFAHPLDAQEYLLVHQKDVLLIW
jgi:co-chaperonin GroES (HSP10)